MVQILWFVGADLAAVFFFCFFFFSWRSQTGCRSHFPSFPVDPWCLVGAALCRTSKPLRKASKLTSKNSVMSKWCQEPQEPQELWRLWRSPGTWKSWLGDLDPRFDMLGIDPPLVNAFRRIIHGAVGRYMDHQCPHDKLAICYG